MTTNQSDDTPGPLDTYRGAVATLAEAHAVTAALEGTLHHAAAVAVEADLLAQARTRFLFVKVAP